MKVLRVRSQRRLSYGICIAIAMLLYADVTVFGGEAQTLKAAVVETHNLTAMEADENENVLEPDETVSDKSKDTLLVSEVSAGYRFFSVEGNRKRAAEYEYLRSNPEVLGLINYLGLDNKFILEGNFRNDKDFFGDLSYDHKGIYRFQLRTESFFHNLDHEGLFSPSPFTSGSGATYNAVDLNPTDSYGLRTQQDQAKFRYKFPLYPFHVTLEYWRMTKEGTIQQRFADQAFEGTQNYIYSQSRKTDRETHEGNLVFDTHLGFIDLIYDFKIRQFGENNGTPRDSFSARTNPDPATYNTYVQTNGSGLLPHNETPDSRYYSNTIKLHTSLSGGIVGVASYTFAKRENLSGLNDIKGADNASDTMHNVAGDLTYTPCGFFSMALKYRRQEIDRYTPTSLLTTNTGYSESSFYVRPAIDTVKDTITATFTFLPARLLTINGEYKGEFLNRDNLEYWNRSGTTASIALQENVNLHKGTLTLLSRPLKGLRLKAQYSYSTADNAIYANSYEQKHQGSILVTYNSPGRWGITANGRFIQESSDHLYIDTLELNSPSTTLRIPRERDLENATFSVWFSPLRNLTISGSYGLLHSKVEQGVLFSGTSYLSDYPTDYTSQSQVYSLSAVYTPLEMLDLSLVLQQVRSFSQFDAGFTDSTLSNEIRGISQVSTRENSLSARGEFRITKNVSCLIDYSYSDYYDKSNGSLSGTVHSVTANLKAKW